MFRTPKKGYNHPSSDNKKQKTKKTSILFYLNLESDIVVSDPVVVSQKRNARSKKTTNSNLICVFEMMHGLSDFSSLTFNIKLIVEQKNKKNEKIVQGKM